MPAPYSFNIAGSGYNVRPWPKALVSPAIRWVNDSKGNPRGSDRGASQDIYEAQAVFYDTESNINALAATFEANREGLTLNGFTAPLFAPNVNHLGSISATVVDMGRRRHLKFAAPLTGVYEIPVTFRALSPTLLSTTPSLATLRLQEGFQADKSFVVGKSFSYSQVAFYQDQDKDQGQFTGVFRQKIEEVRAILAYLLVTARANSFTFPSIGVAYPFGPTKSATPNCRVTKFLLERKDFVFWDINIEFTEVL